MNNIETMMSPISLILSFSLVLIALAIAFKEDLGIEKEMLYAVIRMVIQLIIVGFVLEYIFQLESRLVTILIIVFMCFNAAYNASKRGEGIPHAFRTSIIAIALGASVSLTILVVTGAINFTSQEMIPVTGMIGGQAMNIIGLSFRNIRISFKDHKQEIEEKLALGADTKLASKSLIRESIQGSLQPTVDTIKTVGLVTLPGMMSGLILAGANPISAIMYQMMVYFMIAAVAVIASVTTVYLSSPYFFDNGRLLQSYEKE